MSDTNSLSMIDEFGGRNQIIPAETKGRFRRWRTQVHFVLLLIFLLLPWINIGGAQAVHFDIPGRRFQFFGLLLLSHDSPILFSIFALSALLLMLTTALWGRVWCGWACPQTVFIDAVYRRIEIWVEGNYIQRRRLAQSSMNFEKFLKTTVKWFLFFVVSSLIAHSFVAYFTGSRRLITMITSSPEENWYYFVLISSVTSVLLFNFGWFREQFCIIMCPYGRLQNVLMDQQSQGVVYAHWRGEPRKGKAGPKQVQGDCVSCQRCVQVCPTGIDIRNGLQLECISCNACIDACDEIMEKVGKSKGLIYYGPNSPEIKPNYFRPRILAYVTLILLISTAVVYTLANRLPFSVAVLRAKETPYQLTGDERVINHFKAHLMNQSKNDQTIEFILSPESKSMGVQITEAESIHKLEVGESRVVHLFLSFPRSVMDANGTVRLKFVVRGSPSGDERPIEIVGVGPNPSSH